MVLRDRIPVTGRLPYPVDICTPRVDFLPVPAPVPVPVPSPCPAQPVPSPCGKWLVKKSKLLLVKKSTLWLVKKSVKKSKL